MPGLGRLPNKPDDRDWTTAQLHDHLVSVRRTTPDINPNQTLAEAASGLSTWRQVIAFAAMLWAWIKHNKPNPPTPPPVTNLWADEIVLDQGNYGTCTGNTGAGWMASEPVSDPGVDEALARKLYYEATCLDGQCDSSYQNGSTSRSLAKVLKARGRLEAYAFATDLAEIDEWLDNHGPVMIGINWYEDMFNPDAGGVVHVSGALAGGHEVLVRYREPGTGYYRCRNSWGVNWGDHGDFLILATDLNRLVFKEGGDALLAAELPL